MSKHSRVIAHVVAFGIGFGTVGAALAQEPSPQQPQPTSPRTTASQPSDARESSDNAFVRKAAAGGHAEVELANLAMQKSSSDVVKQLAQRIESDHKKANAELMAIATSKNLNVDSKPMPEHTKTKARVEKLSGAQFDRAYLDTMVKDHQKTIEDFEQQARAGSDAELKAFASKTLPDLKEHLKMTMDAQKTVTMSQK